MYEPSKLAEVGALVKDDDPSSVVAYYCKSCGTVYSDLKGSGRYDAEHCGQTSRCAQWSCSVCGEPSFATYQRFCRKCMEDRQHTCMLDDLNKASSITEAEYGDGPVYYDGEFYDSITDMEDELDGEQMPKRVWVAKAQHMALNVDDALDHMLNEYGSDVYINDLPGVEELDEAVKAFNKLQTARMLYGTSTAVVLDGVSK